MASISPEFVERYQLEFAKNPRSRIFAPLAEAYRQMGLLDEAVQICSKGVHFNPDFAGGRVAFAKVLLNRGENEKALTQLEKATQLAPDNILAQSLLAETWLNLRRPKDALNAYKMVLLINPQDERALSAVRKWEFLSADDYEDDLFEMQPQFAAERLASDTSAKKTEAAPVLQPDAELKGPAGLVRRRDREIERAVSLADAFTVRGEFDKALALLERASNVLGPAKEIEKRLTLLIRRSGTNETDLTPVRAAAELSDEQRQQKIQKLELFLQRITERRLAQ